MIPVSRRAFVYKTRSRVEPCQVDCRNTSQLYSIVTKFNSSSTTVTFKRINNLVYLVKEDSFSRGHEATYIKPFSGM